MSDRILYQTADGSHVRLMDGGSLVTRLEGDEDSYDLLRDCVRHLAGELERQRSRAERMAEAAVVFPHCMEEARAILREKAERERKGAG